MFTNIVASNDNALLCYDDVITPIYGYNKDTYDIRRNYPYESCHNHEGNYFLAEHNLPNTQLIYSVQVVYDSSTPIITNEKDYAYVGVINFPCLWIMIRKFYVILILLSLF